MKQYIHSKSNFLVSHNASTWIAFTIAIIAATMMHPVFASIIALAIVAGFLVVARLVARLEGRVGKGNWSVWLCWIVAVASATMMHPNFTSILCIGLIGVLLWLLRIVCHLEGESLQDVSSQGTTV